MALFIVLFNDDFIERLLGILDLLEQLLLLVLDDLVVVSGQFDFLKQFLYEFLLILELGFHLLEFLFVVFVFLFTRFDEDDKFFETLLERRLMCANKLIDF